VTDIIAALPTAPEALANWDRFYGNGVPGREIVSRLAEERTGHALLRDHPELSPEDLRDAVDHWLGWTMAEKTAPTSA
jgi:hypothetical protein